jgi:serine/threonine-protein kinase
LKCDRLEFLKLLGRGGMGEVWKARDRELQRDVAVKRLRPEMAARHDLVYRFFQEALAAAQLKHQHIVPVYRLDRDLQGVFLEMEFIAGQSLAELLREQGPLLVPEAVRLMLPICDAVSAAHAKNIIHRNIKPGNILIGADGQPRLTDFGLAHFEFAAFGDITQTGAVLGTPDYMAPEQREPPRQATAASDQWSLAGILYETVTGERPRCIDLEGVPDDLRGILGRALCRQPDRRYASVAEFRQVLTALAQSFSG